MSNVNFNGRVAVVTGAGGGLGKTYALELGRRGAKVVVNDLGGASDGSGQSQSMADATVEEIRAAGGEAVPSYDSVSTPAGGEAIIKSALDRYGQVDIVINNAGILRDKTFVKLAPEDLRAVLAVHLEGAFYVSQPAFRAMKDRGYGRFVFTASTAGIFGNFGQSNYGAAKMGLVGLSNVLAIEGARYGIKSNVVAPIARTRMTETLLGPLAEALGPEKVMPLTLYLASEECELSHEVFSAGGGRYARIFVGLTPGWSAGQGASPSPSSSPSPSPLPSPLPSIEDVRDHIGEIMSTDGHIIPASAQDEMALLAKALQS